MMDSMKRIRTDPAVVAYSLYLYFNSRSYRLASKSLEPIVKRTHVSIRKWVQRFKCADKFRADKRSIKVIFVDETLIKINGKDHWLWIAYEPNIHSCLLFHLSRERTIFDVTSFSRKLEVDIEIK